MGGEPKVEAALVGYGAPGEIIYGESAYWRYWWDQLAATKEVGAVPLTMDIVLPDDGEFVDREWITGFDAEIRDYVLREGLLTGRAVVPPASFGSQAEPLLELGMDSGFEVRVLSTEARFVIYGESAAVVSANSDRESSTEGAAIEGLRADASSGNVESATEFHRVLRGREILAPLTGYFETMWKLAVPWDAYRGERERIMVLLAQGWTDARIAEELSLSQRTVSRRVSEAMSEHRATSRFELGVRYARGRGLA